MKDPLISVIIPVFNPGKHLIRCLESILCQTYCNLQVILIDDGSTDGSSEICDKYAEQDTRIVCVHQKNSGVSAARNKGLELATGDFYHFPDSDDYLETDTYEYLLNRISEKKCDIIGFEYFITYPDHEIRHHVGDQYYGEKTAEEAQIIVLDKEPFCCNKLFPKEAIKGNSKLSDVRFCEEIFRGEDSLFVQLAVERTKTVWFDKRPLYHYVQSQESAVRGAFRESQMSALKLYDAYKPLINRNSILKKYFYPKMAHLMISLYYDMWIDKRDFKSSQEAVYNAFKQHERKIYIKRLVTRKEMLKFRFFSLSPNIFCRFHKLIHHL